MCGAIGFKAESPLLKSLMNDLSIPLEAPTDHNLRPNAEIQIAINRMGTTLGVKANWWLFQARNEAGYTYDKRYKSFNTRKDKLLTNRITDFTHNRCVIPASCFYEWKGERFKIEPVDNAIAFGGLYKTWPTGGESPHYSCSVITLPPHERFCHIHDKSLPLMLLPNEIAPWLDESFHDLNYWSETLQSKIRFPLRVTPVDKIDPSREIGDSQIIEPD